MTKDARKSLADLLAVMAALRTPGTGCPWDLEQNFRTIAPYTIEEAYEVADAIEKGDMGALKEELGDLLLQVVYHARMAEEEGAFAFADVVDAITAKMIRRHPHVFGSEAERAAGAAPGFWERIKAEERARPRQPSPSPHRAEGGLRHDGEEGPAASGRRAGRPPRAHARRQVAGQSRQGRLRLALARAGVRQAQGGARRAGGGDRQPAAESSQDRRGVRRPAVRGRQRRPASEDRSGGRAAGGEPEVHPPLPPHRGAAGRAGAETPAQSTLEEMDRLWDQAKREERTGSEPSP